jgi:hypothetical protein
MVFSVLKLKMVGIEFDINAYKLTFINALP